MRYLFEIPGKYSLAVHGGFAVSWVTAHEYGPQMFVFHKSEPPAWFPFKAYLTSFICMAVKAVHLDIVTDISTE